MTSQENKKITLKIKGTHCASCEILIERKFKEIPGVHSVNSHFANGKTIIHADHEIALHKFNEKLEGTDYIAEQLYEEKKFNSQPSNSTTQEANSQNWKEVGAAVIIFFGLYLILKKLNFIPASFGLEGGVSYGAVFVIGLIAATSSCLAVTGGLLLSVAAKFTAANPELTGVQKFRPHIFFNIGRLIGYAGFGALVGGLGSVLSISPRISGLITIMAAILMIILGLQNLNIFPAVNRIKIHMPKWIGHRIHESGSDKTAAPFLLGAMTFFLPCGFTQSLQLYVLSQGSWLQGGLIMLIFALGTLPALASLGAITSFSKGNTQRYFLKFSGVMVISMGLFSFRSGMTLAQIPFPRIEIERRGVNTVETSTTTTNNNLPAQELVDGKQIVRMRVSGYEYSPSQFTVKAGVPVEWHIDGTKAAGCGRVLIMQDMGIQKFLNTTGETVINFTPTKAGRLPFNCSMGMMTPGASFTVTD